jgi:hypothetical protein
MILGREPGAPSRVVLEIAYQIGRHNTSSSGLGVSFLYNQRIVAARYEETLNVADSDGQ